MDINIYIQHQHDAGNGMPYQPNATNFANRVRAYQKSTNDTTNDVEFVHADSDEMQDALGQISQELNCPNTLEDMLFAIDALRKIKPQPAIEWSDTLCAGKRVNHAKAIEACSALGEGWRLPTRVELLSLVDDTRHEPAIDTARFPDTKSGAYWTSTLCAWASSDAWIVGFGYGDAYGFHRDYSSAFVRAVRSLPAGQ